MIYLPEESNLSDRYVHLVFCRETQILRSVLFTSAYYYGHYKISYSQSIF